MNDTTDLTDAVDAWLAAGADSEPEQPEAEQPAQRASIRIHGFNRALDELKREIARRVEFEAQIIQIMSLTGMSRSEAEAHLKRKGQR